MNKIFLVSVLALMSLSFSAFATYHQYGQAGCGLGSMAFGPEKGKVQILAMTTNGTFGTQTFGITSGTSNCTPDARVTRAVEFINNNISSLEVELAQGQGETLISLSQIMGCKQGQEFGKSLQKYYGHVFSNSQLNPEEIYHSINQLSQYDRDLSANCPQTI